MEKKSIILSILDLLVIIILIGTCLYVYHEKSLVKDIASGKTNPCYQCMHKMNWQCFQNGQPIMDEYMNKSQTLLKESCATYNQINMSGIKFLPISNNSD
jgi:hypothetical protein